jgi:hypothetical protein
MSNHARCLRALERAQLWRNLAAAGAPYGISADDLLDEARRYFALPLAEQLAELDTLTDEFSGEELADMRAFLIREYRPMTTL